MTLNADTRAVLLNAALHSIKQRLIGSKTQFGHDDPNPVLWERHATFVTLKRHGVLRGCIGSLDAKRALLDDVIHNAGAAAFDDPRFPALTAPELENLYIEISVLSVAEPLRANSRVELLRLLKPGKDGLTVQEGTRRATFLPAVWKSLPDAGTFYDELMKKAGLGAAYWSTALKFFRYHAESFRNEG